MITVKCTTDKGNSWITGINATLDEAKQYFLNMIVNFGDTDEHPKDNIHKIINVEEVVK